MDYITVFGGLFSLLLILFSWNTSLFFKDKYQKILAFFCCLSFYSYILLLIAPSDTDAFSSPVQDDVMVFVFQVLRDNLFLNSRSYVIFGILGIISLLCLIYRSYVIRKKF